MRINDSGQVIETLSIRRSRILGNIAKRFDTPLYVYFEADILRNLKKFFNIPAPFGLIVRYAIKANSNVAILSLCNKNGAYFDASTFNECIRALAAGIEGERTRLTSQEVQSPANLKFLARKGISYTAGSLLQLQDYGEALPNTEISIRFNVGIGSGWTPQTSTGGRASSFGIYKQQKEVNRMLKKYNLCLKTVHLHIGSGSNPVKQRQAIRKGLAIAKRYSTVTTLNMGGGFKVAGMNYEHTANIDEIGQEMGKAIKEFYEETGRKIQLEVEPGTAIIANAGYILTQVIDKVNTGKNGMEFLKIDGGMNMNARIALYGAQHPVVVIPRRRIMRDVVSYVVAGICCESGDVLTVATGQPGYIKPRLLHRAEVGDLLIIGRAGAYCSSMSPGNYNSQQLHPEILVREDGALDLIRVRQPVNDIWRYERIPDNLKS